MSSNLDKSLDEVIGANRGPRRQRRGGPKPAVVGGVQKKTAQKPAKGPKAAPQKATVAAPVPTKGDSKIIVSNLPDDVTEQQIKEYFQQSLGSVRRVMLTYNKTGRSTGVATIIFNQANLGAAAAKQFNGVKVDGKPMKIEVVMGAEHVASAPAPKSLGERISYVTSLLYHWNSTLIKSSTPKNAAAKAKGPKPAKAGAAPAAQGTAAAAGTGGRARGRNGRKGGARPKKTQEQLDADMADYFDGGANAGGAAAPATNGTAAAPAAATNGGEAVMQDEIM
ncbi:hypothetical protein MBLNU457_5012t2 [Dothideomycetes sp. NU457]